MQLTRLSGRGWLTLVLMMSEIGTVQAQCQESSPFTADQRAPLLPYHVLLGIGHPAGDDKTPTRIGRFPLFRMPTGFLNETVGLETEDDNPGPYGDRVSLPSAGVDTFSDSKLGLSIGNDNPFFDFQSPGDPGGVGYYKLHTQLQLLDTKATCLSVIMQAITPAGLDSAGTATGPTVFRPTVACSQEFGSGVAVHGFIGKLLPARAGWVENLERGLHYGVALQSPVTTAWDCSNHSVHLFVEALGTSRQVPMNTSSPPPRWDVIPGLHWQLRDNWWLSSGVIVPLRPTRYDPGLLHFTCSWRF